MDVTRLNDIQGTILQHDIDSILMTGTYEKLMTEVMNWNLEDQLESKGLKVKPSKM